MADDAPAGVLLVDDHDLIRQGLARAFERDNRFVVVGQAGSVAEGERLMGSLSPRVVVTDVRLPDGTGLDLVRRLRLTHPELAIVVLTMYAGDDQLFAAMDAGASAFVAKDMPADQVLAAAVHALIAPHSFTAEDFAAAMRRKLSDVGPRLSPRELEVLGMLGNGLGITALAMRLHVSESTAKTHVSKIYEKLGAANRAQAITIGFESGLLGRWKAT